MITSPKKLLELSGCGTEDLAGVAIHEVEAERGRRLTETPEYARALLHVVGIGTRITIDEFTLQCAIDQDGQLAAVAVMAWGLPMRPASRR